MKEGERVLKLIKNLNKRVLKNIPFMDYHLIEKIYFFDEKILGLKSRRD